jgi:hypothetical protein
VVVQIVTKGLDQTNSVFTLLEIFLVKVSREQDYKKIVVSVEKKYRIKWNVPKMT